jgi:hypothetical protein
MISELSPTPKKKTNQLLLFPSLVNKSIIRTEATDRTEIIMQVSLFNSKDSDGEGGWIELRGLTQGVWRQGVGARPGRHDWLVLNSKLQHPGAGLELFGFEDRMGETFG